jgi:NifU-like protein involved in Fe-S cluster formation
MSEDPLYAKPLLRLAAAATGAGRLSNPDATGEGFNPACGDRVSITLNVDDDGRITALAHEAKACVLTQASAAILGGHLTGANAAQITALRDQISAMLTGGEPPPSPFAGYAALAPAANYPGRHTCVLLPLDAVLTAIATLQKS